MIDASHEPAAASQSPEKSASPDAKPAGIRFSDFALDERLRATVAALGFDTPTPIQEVAIPAMLTGADVVGSARTGSGKTAAFGLPLLNRLIDGPNVVRAIVLAPTRELCGQVAEALRTYSEGIRGLSIATIYGGAPYSPQIQALRGGCRIVVGTPGRVIDHLDRGTLKMDNVEVFVLDEADEMLQMGFIDDVDKILAATPDGRQIALFSATMPPAIRRIADRYLKSPTVVRPDTPRTSVDHVTQCFMVVPGHNKVEALYRFLCSTERDATLVFARTRAGCGEIADELNRRGLAVDALHGDLAQPARERVIAKLRKRTIDIVIATDVAARGLDIDHISHVINLDLPMNPEVYVHRVGRTARAGRAGVAISFAMPSERGKMTTISRHLHADIKALPVPSDAAIAAYERGRLIDRLAAMSIPNDADAADQLVAELAERTGWTEKQIAVRTLRALALQNNLSMNPRPSEEPPPWSQPRQRTRNREPARHHEPMVELLIHGGRRDGARPADVVASLAKGRHVPGEAIGRISVLATKTFVQITPEAMQTLLAAHDTMQLRGNDIRIEEAKPRRPMPGRDDRPSGPPDARRERPEKRVKSKIRPGKRDRAKAAAGAALHRSGKRGK